MGAVREVPMRNLLELGVRDAQRPAADSGHSRDSGMIESVTEGVSADHSGRADNYKTPFSRPERS